jgi:hypothetical protein
LKYTIHVKCYNLGCNLVTKCNTRKAILDAEHIEVNGIHTLGRITTGNIAKCNLGGVYAAEVKRTTGLGLTDVEAERPCVKGGCLKKIVGEVLTMHLRDNAMMIMTGHILREGCTINVKSGITESV